MMVKISVIIPVYNVENYISETLESLIQQTVFEDIEVLMIDDGSTDDSRYIIEKYANEYDNFHAFHKENEGPGPTRNYGLTLAQGEYINFLDADDYLPPNAYETLLNLASDNDIISGNLLRYKRYNTWNSFLFLNSYNTFTEVIPSTTLDETPLMVWDTSTSNKLYRKDFIDENKLRFLDEKTFYEDLFFSFKSYILAKSIAITPEVTYFWRVRGNRISATQQVYNIQNLMDRIKIINHLLVLIDEYELNDEIVHQQYIKWLKNDFKVHLRRINDFPIDQIPDVLKDINSILELIPEEIKNNLNSYLRVVYKMVESLDVDGLLNFANLEKDLKANPVIPDNFDDKYVEYIDFESDAKKEELKAEVFEIDEDNQNILLRFSEQIDFHCNDEPHDTEAFLVDGCEEYALEVDNGESVIVLPADLIKGKTGLRIKVNYKTDSYVWQSLLTSKNRFLHSFDDFDVDICKSHNHLLIIDAPERSKDNNVEIVDVDFDQDEFIIKGVSQRKISQMMIRNVLEFKVITYDVDYLNDNEFICIIPYKDILNGIIKKWELNSIDSLNSIEVDGKFKFFKKHSSTLFTNSRNKVLISNDILNPVDELNDLFYYSEDLKQQLRDMRKEYRQLNREKRKLVRENKKLNNEVEYLNNRVEEFKSRKIVRLADKFKFK